MNGFFSFDGPLYKSCEFIYETFMLNLLWFIGSIPIVTIGASTSALYYVYGKRVRGKGYGIYSDFFKGYRENFKQSSIVGVVITILLSLSLYNVMKLNSLGQGYRWLFWLQVFIAFQISLVSVFMFSLIARFNMKLMDIIKNSVIMAYKYIFISLPCVLIFWGLLELTCKFPSCALFLVSFYALISSYLIEIIYKKLILL